MINPQQLADVIQSHLTGAEVELLDKTGESNHFIATVKSPAFEGHSLMDRHRMVYSAVKPFLNDGRLHAIEITTEC